MEGEKQPEKTEPPTRVEPRSGDGCASGDGTGALSDGRPRKLLLAGRYELIALLGAGGMGSVYSARDRELGERVALKMLRKQFVRVPALAELFRDEVRLARRVTHPNVARTYDIGEHEGEKFITMEFIDGAPLRAMLQRGALDPKRAIDMSIPVCAGLAAAHEAGVIHRDLKPDNVLVTHDGVVKITDFGIARAAGARDAGGATSGTPAYMSPEQLIDGCVEASTDVYSLGVMLFELLTGKKPWPDAASRLVADPPDPRAICPELAVGLAELVLRCMARAPSGRPASAAVILVELERIRAEMTSSALPPRLEPLPTRPDEGARAVAVISFRNAGPPEDGYLANGLSEDLVDALAAARALRVCSRVVANRPGEAENRNAAAAGGELDVQAVVEGSVRRVGDRVRIWMRLVGVDDAFALWSRRYDCSPAELLAIVDEAAAEIAGALAASVPSLPRSATRDPRAVDLYLRARHHYHEFWEEGAVRAVALFEEALALAPSDPMILAGFAMARQRRIWFDQSSAREAEAAAERAVTEAPHLGDAWLARATVEFNQGREVLAAADLLRALSLAPSSPEAQVLLGRILSEVGKPEEAILRWQLAEALDPRMYFSRLEAARIHGLLGRWSACDELLGKPPAHPAHRHAYFFVRWRCAIARGPAEIEQLLAEMKGDPVADQPFLHALASVLIERRFTDEMDARCAPMRVAPLQRARTFIRQIEAEIGCLVGDYDLARAAMRAGDREGLLDVEWTDRAALLAPLRHELEFAEWRAHVAARATPVLLAVSAA